VLMGDEPDLGQVERADESVAISVDGERVDVAHGVVLAQTLELRDDLTVEPGMVEAQHDQLDGSDGHCPRTRPR
jgi:hypothetical protein